MERGKIWDGIKNGDEVRIVLRSGFDIKNSPPVGSSVALLKDGKQSQGIITAGVFHKEDDVLDLTVTPYYKLGHRVDDGQVTLIVTYQNFDKAQRLNVR